MLLDLQLDARPDQATGRATALVGAGAAGLFTFEGPHDVFLPLASVAGRVEADLMTNVAIAMPRSPMHLAHAAWDLQLMSGGRFRLGLGSQVRPHIENRYGATWSPPAARMREIVLAVKAILASWQDGTRLDFRGEHTRHTLMPPTFVPGPNPFGPPPVLLGALGPVMTRTAAEVADGLLVMPFHSHRHFRERTLPAVQEGLSRAGRDRVDVFPQAILAMGSTEQAREHARVGVRALLAFYGSTPAYRPVLDIEGWGHLQPELNAHSKRGDIGAMTALVSDEMVHTLAVTGTPEECAAELVRRFGDVADRVCAYFPGHDPGVDDIARLSAALRGSGVDGTATMVARSRREDIPMGAEDKASNSFKDTKGKLKETTGKLTDNERLENEGKGDQVEASIKDGVEHLKDAAGNVKDAFKK